MPNESSEPGSREGRVDAVIAEYLEGGSRDRAGLLACHPDLAEELNAFFTDHDQMKNLAHPIPAEAPTLPPEPSRGEPPAFETIRYFGDYEIMEEIARGGMGVVYKARQISLNRVVALKMILAGQLATPADVERFLREAEAAANLDHPNIVPIYEVGVHQGHHYFSMKLIDGGTLKDEAGKMTDASSAAFIGRQRFAAAVVAQAARAVHYAHQRGIIHRDLKAANILLAASSRQWAMGRDEPCPEPGARQATAAANRSTAHSSPLTAHCSLPTVMVTDFGLARRIESDRHLSQTGTTVGTPAYMAPEQARAEKTLTTSVDVYSLGAILYELLTGRPPFCGVTQIDIILQVLERVPDRPRTIDPAIDRSLELICLKCLEKEPAQRYSSAEALADDLERWQRGEPISARPVSSLVRAGLWCRRNPAFATLAATLCVALLAGTALSTYFAVNANEEKWNFRRLLYDAQMNLVQRAWENNQTGLVVELLERQRPKQNGDVDLRGFEWHYWHRRFHSELRDWLVPGGARSVAFSPDGARLAVGVNSGERHPSVLVFDAAGGAELLKIAGNAEVRSLVFSPDGRYLAGAIDPLGGVIKVWNAETGRETFRFSDHAQPVIRVAFSPDGSALASASWDGIVRLWDMESGKVRAMLNCGGPAHCLAFHPEGKRLAIGKAFTAALWDLTTQKEIKAFTGPFGNVVGVAFSADGQRLAAGGSGQITIWDVASDKALCTVTSAPVADVAFSRDGSRVAAGCLDGNVCIWEVPSGAAISSLRGHTNSVLSVAFRPDGRQLASAGDQTVKIWDAASSQQMPIFKIAGGPQALLLGGALRPNWTQVAGGDQNGVIHVWEIVPPRELVSLYGHADKVADPPLASGGDMWWRPLVTWPATPVVAFHPDGAHLASASADGTARIWNVPKHQQLFALTGHTGGIYSLAFSTNGRRLATGSGDRSVIIWDVDSGQALRTLTGHRHTISSTAFNSRGDRLAAAAIDTVTIWNPESGKQLATLETQPFENNMVFRPVTSLAFSPDGSQLAAATAGADHAVLLWDLSTGRLLHVMKGHSQSLNCVAFHPDGSRLASGGDDRTVRIWNTRTGQEVLLLTGHTGKVTTVEFSADGSRLASLGGPGDLKLRVWETAR